MNANVANVIPYWSAFGKYISKFSLNEINCNRHVTVNEINLFTPEYLFGQPQ
jgi:hypothetical protein